MGQKERLLQFVEQEKISKAEFERNAGLANGYVNKLKGNMGEEKLNGILTAFPNLNRVWLLTGEGNMLNTDMDKSVAPMQEEEPASGIMEYETYLLPMTAHGGSLIGIPADGVSLQNCERIVSPIKGVDFAISVYGDSMSPEYPSGSRVLIKKIDHTLFIDWGRAYVVDTPNGVILKELLRSERDGYVVCRSLNQDPKYSDFEIPIAEIYGVYRVLMCLSAK